MEAGNQTTYALEGWCLPPARPQWLRDGLKAIQAGRCRALDGRGHDTDGVYLFPLLSVSRALLGPHPRRLSV